MFSQAKQKPTLVRMHKCRQSRGSGIILGVVSSLLLVCSGVMSVLLLLNTGVSMYYREKLGFIADQAATYASTYSAFLQNTGTRDSDVSAMVNALMSSMDLNSSNTTVSVTGSTSPGQQISVTITANLPIVTSSAFSSAIPQRIRSTYTAVATNKPYANSYIVSIDPLFGKTTGNLTDPAGQLPPDGQPAWFISLGQFYKLR
jgi:hypothetical protein